MSDFDDPACYREITRRARKPHRCCECRREITPGTDYEHASGVWDGRPAAFSTCARCVRVKVAHRAGCRATGLDPAAVFGGLVEAVREAIQWDCHDYLTAFRAAWRNRILTPRDDCDY